jgi:hypothetical protein
MYIDPPLWVFWSDLCDERRRVILLDPETLEQELIVNPHAVVYETVEAQEVLDGKLNVEVMQDKHVMPSESRHASSM